jgi:hypothetical protein
MNLPPKQDEPRLEGHDTSKVSDLTVARSARETARISAMVDLKRGNVEPPEILTDQDIRRNTQSARRLLEISRQAETMFEGPLLSNPGWDILLDLFIQRNEGKRISIISVCVAANAPTSTVLRYIQAMIDSGAIVKKPSLDDSESLLIDLSDAAFARMNSILT